MYCLAMYVSLLLRKNNNIQIRWKELHITQRTILHQDFEELGGVLSQRLMVAYSISILPPIFCRHRTTVISAALCPNVHEDGEMRKIEVEEMSQCFL